MDWMIRVLPTILTIILCGSGAEATTTFTPAANNSELQGLVGATNHIAYRAGYSTAGDGGAGMYTWSSSACTLGGGAGDNGYQVKPTSGGGCWILEPQYPLNRMIWGVGNAPVFYVANSGSGNDYSGANSCLISSDPCATINQAVKQAYQVPWYGTAQVISIGTGKYNETVAINGTVVPALAVGQSLVGITLSGSGSSSTTIAGDGVQCATVAASGAGANVTIQNLKLTAATAASCQSALFAEWGGQAIVASDVNFGAANVQHMHAEETGALIQILNSYTVSGGAAQHIGATAGGQVVYNPASITVTISGTPTFSSAFILSQYGAVVFIAQGTTFSGSIGSGDLPFVVEGNALVANAVGTGLTLPGTGYPIERTGGRIAPVPTVYLAALGTPTGLGTGGSASVAGGSHSGLITLTTGSAPSSSGSVPLNFNTQLEQDSAGGAASCSATLNLNRTASWAGGATATFAGIFLGPPSATVYWYNAGFALAASKTYLINYVCD